MNYRGYNVRYQPGIDPVTTIILINVIIYFFTSFSDDLYLRMGLIPAEFGSQPWTLVTSMFVHANLWHLFANMLAPFFLGRYLHRSLGDGLFLLVYFGGGILGSLFYLLLGAEFSIAVGASGAIFAVGGTLALLQPHLKVIIFPIFIPISLWIAVFGGFLLLSFLPNVAWEGHLGGLLFGIGVGYYLKRVRRLY
jgi:membrane associated rhomboid family serine protease